MAGFVYVWRDRMRNMFYVGSHWGDEDDGYVCSSARMKRAHARRAHDFRRRVVSRVSTTYRDLLMEEQRWLYMIPDHRLGSRYYNLTKRIGHWRADPDKVLTVGQKIGARVRGLRRTAEQRAAFSRTRRETWAKLTPEERRERMSRCWTEKRRAAHSETMRRRHAEGNLVGGWPKIPTETKKRAWQKRRELYGPAGIKK